MPTVSEVLAILDRTAPAASAAAWDPVGLQVGDPAAEVSSLALCHEVTEDVISALGPRPPDLLVTYHPLLYRPTTRLVAGRTPSGRALRLAETGVSLAVVHTSFDGAAGGTADALAGILGLEDVSPFGEAGQEPVRKVVTFVPAPDAPRVVAAMSGAGAGRIGNYSGCSFRVAGIGTFEAGAGADPSVGETGVNRVNEVRVEMLAPAAAVGAVTAALVTAHPYEEPAYDVYETASNGRFIGRIGSHDGTFDALVARAAKVFGGDGTRVSRSTGQAERVAVLPGSGSAFLDAARAHGADVIVTGDVDHHRARQAVDGGMAVIDPGHAATERPGMVALRELVASALPALELVDLTGHDPTPWR
jgi:dinuclear metal center YbgI/SA1388 family protein